MSTRPPLDRKITRKTEEKRTDELDQGIRITIGGETHEARVGDITPEIARELRANAGMSFMRLMDTLADDPDVDVLSAFVWVSRRLKGEAVPFGDVVVTYADMLADGFDIDVAGSEDVDGSPEA